MPSGALSGIRVVEYSLGPSGATCAKTFADLGADVLKAEPPEGDPARRLGPFPNDRPDAEASGIFLYLNANKRGVTLDLRRPADRARIHELIGGADIFVTDVQPKQAAALGIDSATVGGLFPRLIRTYVTPFGNTGPYRDWKGTDLIAWHMGGMGWESPAAFVTDPEEHTPLRGRGNVGMYLAGWVAAAGATCALFHRETYGVGQEIDVSAMDAVASHIRGNFATYSYDITRLPESRNKGFFPWIWKTADGYASQTFFLDHWWETLKDMMGRPEWADDEAFDTLAGRRDGCEEIEVHVAEWTKHKKRGELYRSLQSSSVPCFPVQTIDEIVASEHYGARGFFVEQEHPVAGAVKQPGPPVRLFGTPWGLRSPAPTLGQHNSEVAESGFHPPDRDERSSEVTDSGFHPHSSPRIEYGAGSLPEGEGQLKAGHVNPTDRDGRGSEVAESGFHPHPSPLPEGEGQLKAGHVNPTDRDGQGSLTPGTPRSRPLQGVRIIDFGWILSVPYAGGWLGSLGAEVIRVESNTRLEPGRSGLAGAADGIAGVNRSGIWNCLNHSKLGITLNIRDLEAQELVKELVAVSDVVMENFSTGVLDRLGLGYEDLRKVRPDLIMLSGSTMGTVGPERDSTGFGPNVCSYAGQPSITGYEGGQPQNLGGNWPDYLVGTMMVHSVLSALWHRCKTGEGQRIEIAMAEVVSSMIPEAFMEFTMNGRVAGRIGNHDPHMSPHNVYRCAGDDEWVAIAVQSDDEWGRLCEVMGRPGRSGKAELADDSRFATLESRKINEAALDKLIGEWTRERSPMDVAHLLQAEGIAAGPVMDVMALMVDPHFRERGNVIEMEHTEVGPREVAGLPIRFGDIPRPAYYTAPLLGQHNDEVFGRLLGHGASRVSTLRESRAIY